MSLRHVVLFRCSLAEEGELGAVRTHFDVHESRMTLPTNSVVIGRYSVLPYYLELENDLKHVGSRLINSFKEHSYVADLGSYIEDLGDITPRTWPSLDVVPKDAGPFVLKGATNSKKWQWNTHMYARTWNDAMGVYLRLSEDGLIGSQRIYVREYVPLKRLWTSFSGTPITKEFRFFVIDDVIIGSSFYWDSFAQDIVEQGGMVPSSNEVPDEFLREAMRRVWGRCPFYVMDVAQAEDDRWLVIELNDGQMSGLSGIDPQALYSNMKRVLVNGKL